MIRSGKSSAQAVTRARILLKTDEGWTAPQVAAALDISERTVFRSKRRYVEEGLEEVLRHHNSPTGSVCLWGMSMLPDTSSVAGVADVVLVHVDLERAGSLHEGCVRGVHSH